MEVFFQHLSILCGPCPLFFRCTPRLPREAHEKCSVPHHTKSCKQIVNGVHFSAIVYEYRMACVSLYATDSGRVSESFDQRRRAAAQSASGCTTPFRGVLQPPAGHEPQQIISFQLLHLPAPRGTLFFRNHLRVGPCQYPVGHLAKGPGIWKFPACFFPSRPASGSECAPPQPPTPLPPSFQLAWVPLLAPGSLFEAPVYRLRQSIRDTNLSFIKARRARFIVETRRDPGKVSRTLIGLLSVFSALTCGTGWDRVM